MRIHILFLPDRSFSVTRIWCQVIGSRFLFQLQFHFVMLDIGCHSDDSYKMQGLLKNGTKAISLLTFKSEYKTKNRKLLCGQVIVCISLFRWNFRHIHIENFPRMPIKIFYGPLLHKTIIFHFAWFYTTSF